MADPMKDPRIWLTLIDGEPGETPLPSSGFLTIEETAGYNSRGLRYEAYVPESDYISRERHETVLAELSEELQATEEARSESATLLERAGKRIAELEAELSASTVLIAEIKAAWHRYQLNDIQQDEFEGVVAERVEMWSQPSYPR